MSKRFMSLRVSDLRLFMSISTLSSALMVSASSLVAQHRDVLFDLLLEPVDFTPDRASSRTQCYAITPTSDRVARTNVRHGSLEPVCVLPSVSALCPLPLLPLCVLPSQSPTYVPLTLSISSWLSMRS